MGEPHAAVVSTPTLPLSRRVQLYSAYKKSVTECIRQQSAWTCTPARTLQQCPQHTVLLLLLLLLLLRQRTKLCSICAFSGSGDALGLGTSFGMTSCGLAGRAGRSGGCRCCCCCCWVMPGLFGELLHVAALLLLLLLGASCCCCSGSCNGMSPAQYAFQPRCVIAAFWLGSAVLSTCSATPTKLLGIGRASAAAAAAAGSGTSAVAVFLSPHDLRWSTPLLRQVCRPGHSYTDAGCCCCCCCSSGTCGSCRVGTT
jgi:hypothetical protein